MSKKALFLDVLPLNSNIQVGSHKYAQLFHANGYEVFSLSHVLNPYTFIRKNSEDKELIQNWKAGVQKSSKGILFYSPFCYLPYLNMPLLDNINLARKSAKFCIPNLSKLLDQYGFLEVDLVFINNIRLISLLNVVDANLKVYRISDRVESFSNQPKSILALQHEVIKKADLVFATSKNLTREMGKINSHCFYLPNGVNSNFIVKEDSGYIYPKTYPENNKPIALYVGAISDWFDYELYEYGLSKLKDISFVMVGPIAGASYKENLAKIQHFSNTYQNFCYLGPIPHTALKDYLFHASVGIIPFKLTSLTNEINPVKLFEYAAFGLPIVASNMSELQNYNEHVSLYRNKEDYIKLLSNNLVKNNALSLQLRNFALNNSWEKRYEYIIAKLEDIKADTH